MKFKEIDFRIILIIYLFLYCLVVFVCALFQNGIIKLVFFGDEMQNIIFNSIFYTSTIGAFIFLFLFFYWAHLNRRHYICFLENYILDIDDKNERIHYTDISIVEIYYKSRKYFPPFYKTRVEISCEDKLVEYSFFIRNMKDIHDANKKLIKRGFNMEKRQWPFRYFSWFTELKYTRKT